jgi:hypothetical protein
MREGNLACEICVLNSVQFPKKENAERQDSNRRASSDRQGLDIVSRLLVYAYLITWRRV